MATYLIAMPSITYANKANDILNANGYRCTVERTPKNLASGCGYSIRISGDFDEISALLETKGITLRDVMKLGGNRGENVG